MSNGALNTGVGDRGWLAALTGVTLFLFLFRIPLIYLRSFDPDELQHLHSAFSIAAGLVPYEDYFEHHPPWFAGILSMVVRISGPEWGTILVARALMLALCAGILIVSYRTWRAIGGQREACIGVVFLSGILLFLNKSLEIRPDVPAAFLWVLGLGYVIDAARTGRVAKYVIAGLAFGAGLMFTPKLAFGVLGVGLGLTLGHLRRCVLFGAAGHLAGMLALAAAIIVPLLLTVLGLALSGSLGGFVECVVVMPLEWQRELSSLEYLRVLCKQNPFLTLLGAVGIVRLLGQALLAHDAGPAPAVLGPAAAMLALGWFVIPVPWPQYLLLLLPIVAYAAATFCIRVSDYLSPNGAGVARVRWPVLAWGGLVAALAFVVVAVLAHEGGVLRANLKIALSMAGPATLVAVQPKLGGKLRLAVLAAAVLVALYAVGQLQPLPLVFVVPWLLLLLGVHFAPPRDRVLGLLVAVILAAPLAQIASVSYRRNHAFRSEFEFIMRHTEPTDTVLTGWRGTAVFRPHAYRFFFLHSGMLRMLSDEERGEDVLHILHERPPRVVIRDRGVQSLSAEVNDYIAKHYEPSGVGPVWMRKSVEGDRDAARDR